jgi:hypothetical protein
MSEYISRRKVLVGAAVVAGVAALGAAAGAGANAAQGNLPVSLWVTDVRFDESKRFAARAANSARRQFGVASNVPRSCYAALCNSARGEGGTLIGLTTSREFAVMKGCAVKAGFVCRSHNMHLAADGRTKLVSWEFAPAT